LKPRSSVPFRNLTADAWRRLGFLAISILYFLNAGYSIIKLGLFNGMGGDFFSIWTSGKVADIYGYTKIYDVETIKLIQFTQIFHVDLSSDTVSPFPSPYFSIIVLPFKYLSRMDINTSFWLWTAFTFLLLVAYLYFFMSRFSKFLKLNYSLSFVLISMLVSYPVYANFLYGNLEVFILIFAGEFIIASLTSKPIPAGLWLGLLMMKPQVLLLVVPVLLLTKNWRVLLGFSLSAIGILLISAVLSGVEGLTTWFKLLFTYAPGTEFYSPNGMANWRMLATNLNAWTSSSFGWIIAGAGMIATLVLWFRLCHHKYPFGSVQWVLNFGAIFAASLAFTWHSHIHMGMVLIPFLLVLLATNHSSAKRLAIDLWVFSYPTVLMVTYLIALLLMILVRLPGLNNVLAGPFLGITGLAIYMIYLVQGLKIPQAFDNPDSNQTPA